MIDSDYKHIIRIFLTKTGKYKYQNDFLLMKNNAFKKILTLCENYLCYQHVLDLRRRVHFPLGGEVELGSAASLHQNPTLIKFNTYYEWSINGRLNKLSIDIFGCTRKDVNLCGSFS